MRSLPVPGVRALAPVARRTRLTRAALAAILVALVLVAAATARHPGVRISGSLPVHSGDVIVLDLSASISSDTFSRVGETLRDLVASGGRYGLVVFSDVAYEALPPGTPASALEPLIRYYTVPTNSTPGAAPVLPTSPWTLSFSRGTAISAGLDLAHRIVIGDHLAHASVVLISDLADDPQDIQRLNEVVSAEYGRGRTPLHVIALNAAPSDAAYFARAAGAAISEAQLTPAKPSPPAALGPARLPEALVAAIVATFVALAAYALWTARLHWEGEEA